MADDGDDGDGDVEDDGDSGGGNEEDDTICFSMVFITCFILLNMTYAVEGGDEAEDDLGIGTVTS